MLIAISIIFLLLLIFAPQIWTRSIFRRYNQELDQLPGTGAELARHLLNRFGLDEVEVETADNDDNHYDPEARKIRLAGNIGEVKSITSVVIAAHEVGHALQHKHEYKPLQLRSQLARLVIITEKIAAMMLVAFPFAAILTRAPLVGGLLLACGVLILFLPVIFHLFTLPVELDASFNRALPILEQGQYLPDSALPIARKLLLAAALTYLSASLASVLNFYRWLVFLRR